MSRKNRTSRNPNTEDWDGGLQGLVHRGTRTAIEMEMAVNEDTDTAAADDDGVFVFVDKNDGGGDGGCGGDNNGDMNYV